MRGFNPGLVKFHPASNENYLIARHSPRGMTPVAEPFKPVKRLWRNYWRKNDQGQTPRCTAFGTLTDLACTPITHPKHNPLMDPQKFYEQIVAYDRSQGRFYNEGATTDAAMQCARANGWIRAWYWGYTLDTALRAVDVAPIIMGTNWYSSMYDRDAEGIIRISPNASLDGGHLWCINGVNPKRELFRIPQTWGDGDYWIPFADVLRLIREDGELSVIDETPIAA